MKSCLVEECTRKYYAKGYCKLHYGHIIKYGKIFKEPLINKNPNICIVEKCNKKPRAKGYCNRHYIMIKKYGEIIGNTSKTNKDRNEVVFDDKVYHIKLCDIHSNEVAETIIDSEDYELIKKYKWRLSKVGYAQSTIKKGNHISLAEMIMGIETNYHLMIDHINQNKLDNRKINLRSCSRSLNAINSKIRLDNTSGKRGISWDKTRKKWVASLRFEKVRVLNKRFEKKEDAILSRQEAMNKYGLI